MMTRRSVNTFHYRGMDLDVLTGECLSQLGEGLDFFQ